ncbi:hypothetical protein SARC_03174 [Sphaeroforma arctica JP610]|uniref:Calponin-homology (CH) domain-containing protein n=1 Tax=Sphaeroforma arctica JP610 TaxID=667725 RepID=A0A0L0G6W9_9EUKA|nr:hypothetical protein SARC_03174 [Sphaeroforma arctica JP610]KNC84606.1 hypothetical protein SARC_03174 [Sphaeroforma arctica JP610]|eukprot:XP_014158508.1 hypothetical protein SARC_03174 [Sphaeroforma arctica JP610]
MLHDLLPYQYKKKLANTEARIENFGEDLADSVVLATVIRQIKANPELENIAFIENLNARAQVIATTVNSMCSNVGGSTWASAEDIQNGNQENVEALVASLFYNFLSINMPTEAEIDELYKDIDGFKEQLRSCRVCREQYLVKIKWLENDVESLNRRKEELEAGITEREGDHADTSARCEAMVTEKEGEMKRIAEAITMLENDLTNKLEQLTTINKDQKSMEESKDAIVQANKNRIFELEGKVAALKAGNTHMKDLLDGKGTSAAELQAALALSAKMSAEKSRVVMEYLTKVGNLLDTIIEQLPERHCADHTGSADGSATDTTNDSENTTEGTVSAEGNAIPRSESVSEVNGDYLEEKARLRQNRDLQMKVLEGLAEQLNEGKQKTADHIENERVRLEELQRAVADYLQEGQADAMDGIANMKRFLGLMIEKAKKQAMQIGTLEFTIEKKNQLNDVMAEKVKQIAEEQMKKGNILKNMKRNRRTSKRNTAATGSE